MPHRFRYWFLPVALVGVLSMSALTGVALAQDDPAAEESAATTIATPPWKDFASRVARILGTDEAKTQDAFEQAVREQRDEALKARLDSMVAAGKLTQAQADSYLAWLQSRPADLPPALGLGGEHGPELRGFGPGRPERGHHFMGPRGGDQPNYQAPSTEAAPTVY